MPPREELGSRLKILLFVDQLKLAGAELQMLRLADALRRQDHLVRLETLWPAPASEQAPVSDSIGLEISTLIGARPSRRAGRWLAVASAALRLRRRILADPPDVLYSFLYLPNTLSCLANASGSGIATVIGLRSDGLRLGPRRSAVASLNAMVSRRAVMMIANSRVGIDAHRARGFTCPLARVIPNGVDTTLFRPDARAGLILRHRLGLPASASVVTRVARLDPLKDWEAFLRASSSLCARDPAIHLLCVGGGGRPSYVDRLQRLARSLGLETRTVWTGASREMAAVYNASDVVVSSSLGGEGFPNCLAEAMACGVPCVATNVGASREILGHIGGIVPPGQVGRLAEEIERLLHSGARFELRMRCRQRICSRFSLEQVARVSEAALREAVEAEQLRSGRIPSRLSVAGP